MGLVPTPAGSRSNDEDAPTMLPLRSHLTLKRGIFYYRRKLPLPHVGEVAVSLRTSHYREAQHLARVADLAFRSFFRSVPSMADIQTILRQHLVDALEEDRARHLSTPHGRPVYVQGGQLDDHDCPVDADLELIGTLLSDAREALATRNVKRVAHLVQTYMTLHDLGESQRHALAMGLLKADVQALEISERRLVDGAVDEIQLLPASSSTNGEQAVVSLASGPLLSEVLPRFLDLMSTEGGWRAQTPYWLGPFRVGSDASSLPATAAWRQDSLATLPLCSHHAPTSKPTGSVRP